VAPTSWVQRLRGQAGRIKGLATFAASTIDKQGVAVEREGMQGPEGQRSYGTNACQRRRLAGLTLLSVLVVTVLVSAASGVSQRAGGSVQGSEAPIPAVLVG
jgi:hypothetical protein